MEIIIIVFCVIMLGFISVAMLLQYIINKNLVGSVGILTKMVIRLEKEVFKGGGGGVSV